MTGKPFDPAKPCTTRDGRPVRILCTDLKSRSTIVGAIRNTDAYEVIDTWMPDGRLYSNADNDPCDLINVRTKRKGWIGVNPDTRPDSIVAYSNSQVHSSEEMARIVTANVYSQYIEIEFDE